MNYLIIALSLLFFGAGSTKALGLSVQKTHFRHWNLPKWVMFMTGILEISAGILMLFASTKLIGLFIANIIMLGAIIICWISSEYKRSIVTIVIWGLTIVPLWVYLDSQASFYFLVCFEICLLLVAAIFWAYPHTSMNFQGEEERLKDGTLVKHHFEKILGVNYHFVTAGIKGNPVVLLVHGAPESWYCWHNQISELCKEYQVLAVDMKPYGQTSKDLDGDHSFSHIAFELKTLMLELGHPSFNLIGHDRGAVTCDHLISQDGIRIESYIRMQQSFNEPHGDPVPPHNLMKSFLGTLIYKMRFAMWMVYTRSKYTKIKPSRKVVDRIDKEFKFKGVAQAMPLSFKTSNFDQELADRHNHLFEFMTMPILLLQGRFDPGQHPEEYAESSKYAKNLCIKFIEAGHFFHLEAPEQTNNEILRFLKECSEKESEDMSLDGPKKDWVQAK